MKGMIILEINLADSAFILVCTALVFFMTPGLAFFYGGMVRRKNVLNTLLSSFLFVDLHLYFGLSQDIHYHSEMII